MNICAKCGRKVSSSKSNKPNRIYNPITGMWDHVDCVGSPAQKLRLAERQAIRSAIQRGDRLA